MRPLTEDDVRAAFVNAGDEELRLLALPPDFMLTDWDHLDFLAWRDPRTRGRGYLIAEVGRRAHRRRPAGGRGHVAGELGAVQPVPHDAARRSGLAVLGAQGGAGRRAGRQRRHLHLRRPLVPRERATRRPARAQRGARERRRTHRRHAPTHRGVRRAHPRVREGRRVSERVVVIGDALIDELRDDSGVREFVGGAALNVAVGLTRLGVPATLIAMVGDDEAGAHIRAYLARLRRGADRDAVARTARRVRSARAARAGEPVYEFNDAAKARSITFGDAERAAIADAAIVAVSCFPFDDAAQTRELRRRAGGRLRAARDRPEPALGHADRPRGVRARIREARRPGGAREGRRRRRRRCSTASRSMRCARGSSTSAPTRCWRPRVPPARRSRRVTSWSPARSRICPAASSTRWARVTPRSPPPSRRWSTGSPPTRMPGARCWRRAMDVAAATCRFEGALLRLPGRCPAVDLDRIGT